MKCIWIFFIVFFTIISIQALEVANKTSSTTLIIAQPSDYDTFKSEQTLKQAKTALENGLPSIAQDLYENLLNILDLPLHIKEQVLLGLIDAHIQQYQLTEARQYLDNHTFSDKNRYNLRYALASYPNILLETILKDIHPQILPENEKAWFDLLKGLSEIQSNRLFLANDYFEQALTKSYTPSQKIWIETLILHYRAYQTYLTEDELQSLEQKLQRIHTDSPHFQTTLELYALQLHQHHKTAQAINLLHNRLKTISIKNTPEEISTLQTIVIIANKGPEGIQALKRLLISTYPLNVQKTALYQLAQYETPHAFSATLSNLINKSPTSPIIEEALLLQTIIFLNQNSLNEAEEILNKFKSNEKISENIYLKLFADLAYQRKQFKTAADYLLQLEKITSNSLQKAEIYGWIGDLYWLDNDFQSSSKYYSQALLNASLEQKEHFIYQAALSYLRIHQIDEVLHILEHHPLSPENQWLIEWAVSNYFRENSSPHLALNHLLKISTKPNLTPGLKARFYWLISHIYLEIASTDKALEYAQKLITFLQTTPLMHFAEDNFDELMTESLLLQADILMHLNDWLTANDVLNTLRQNYPNSSATERSYLMEGYHEAHNEHPIKAQHCFLQLADYYPQSTYAPHALLNASILSSNQKTPQSQEDAIKYIKRILENYPTSNVVFKAEYEQAKILTRIGAFKDAEIIYQQLLKNTVDADIRYQLTLSQANCIFAQTTEDPKKLTEAIALYERIFEQPHINTLLKNESGYRLGQTFEKSHAPQKAEHIYWQIIDEFLNTPPETNVTGQYWLSRSIFSLADLLKQKNKPDEAHTLYELIIKYSLPGIDLAKSQIKH